MPCPRSCPAREALRPPRRARQLARADQHPALQRADRLVVGPDRGRQRPADALQVPAEPGQPVVKLPAEVEHRPGVLGQRLLLPGVLDGAQHRDQRGRRGDVHTAGQRVLEQARVVLERGREERLAGDEHDHELRRLRQGRPVCLGAELLHVRPQVPGVRGEARLAVVIVSGGGGLQVGGERHLGVDDHVLSAGQPDHHVRPLPALDDHLLVEVHVRGHARELHHPAQLKLAPPAAGLGPPQRAHQRLRLLAELLRAAPGELDLLRELGVRPGPRDVGVAQLLLDAGQGLAHRARPATPRRSAARAAPRRARPSRPPGARAARRAPAPRGPAPPRSRRRCRGGYGPAGSRSRRRSRSRQAGRRRS